MDSKNAKKIIIAEDDVLILEMYAAKFKEAGFEISTAKDGNEVFSKIEESVPDLILLDKVLPNMDGFEIIKKINENPEYKDKIKIVFWTNVAEKEDMEKGLELGAADYLIKAHYTPGKLVEKVREILK